MIKNKILVVDDDKTICSLIKKSLELNINDLYVESSFTSNEAYQKLNNESFDIILLDYLLPDLDGLKLLRKIKEEKLLKNSEIILITGFGDERTKIEAISQGCNDVIFKPFNINNLIFKINKTLERTIFYKRYGILNHQLIKDEENYLIGNSKEIQNVINIIYKITNLDDIVLIEGETGTGKELIAKLIYKVSNRRDEIFIPINCSAFTDTLLESELFGYEKGAFTGAFSKKLGVVEVANNGTIFLDEINNASFKTQSNLLRFIETGEFRRVGGTKILKSNVRIITATNQDLKSLTKQKKIREDLYYRLNVINIKLPSLRERKNDIPLLIKYFVDKYNKKYLKNVEMSKSAMKYLIQYNWPGNVRELKNMIKSLIILNNTGVINPNDLLEEIIKENIIIDNSLSFKEKKKKIISEFEIKYLKNILKISYHNISLAAKIGKLNRKTLIEKLKFYKLL